MKSINEIRADFPLINSKTVYFDNAATTHRPAAVTAAIKEFYDNYNANPLRGLYDLSSLATEMYGKARSACASYINAKCAREIIFTRNTTESINLAAYSLGELLVGEGDNIVISVSEHHSNLLPWQRVAKQKKANLVFMEPDMTGLLSPEEIVNKIRMNGTLLDSLVKVGQIALQLAQQYNPQIADQLAPVLQGIGMEAAGTTGQQPVKQAPQPDAITGKAKDESAGVERARQTVQNATRPAE